MPVNEPVLPARGWRTVPYTHRDREADRGLVAICEGGGTANAMLIERV
jgi:acetyl-CoA acetyltransferase